MKSNRIKKKEEFSNIFSNGKSIKLDSVIIKYAKRVSKHNSDDPRYGIIASKKVGNAVKRNFAKRRIKALENTINTFGNNNLDYVFIAKKNLLSEKFKVLNLEFRKALNKININIL